MPTQRISLRPSRLGLFTFTSDDGQIRYASLGVPFTAGIADNTDLGFLQITLAAGINKFGFLVGHGSDIQPTSEIVSFFDTGGLLGSTSISSSGGFKFVGFENPTGFITEVLINDTYQNVSVVSVDNLVVEAAAVPEPSTLGLISLGLLGLGAMKRRRQDYWKRT